MYQRYALAVYFLIVGNLCLGELLTPFFPIFLPLHRHFNRTSNLFLDQKTWHPLTQKQATKTFACDVATERTEEQFNDAQLSQELLLCSFCCNIASKGFCGLFLSEGMPSFLI